MYTKTLSFSYVFLKKLAVVAIVAGAFFFASSALASTGHNTTGYAWSANIGAISFNCTSQPGGCDTAMGGGGVLEVPEITPPPADDDGVGGLFGMAPTSGTQKAMSLISQVRTHIARFIRDEVATNTAYADLDDVFMGSNYGVSVDPATGIMSGYAWSPYVGWISFEESVGCPEGSCTPTINLATGEVSGWALVLSATGTSGWDGWISLSCQNHSILPWCSSYKVSYDSATGNLSGFAWGDEVVGWVSFSGAGYTVHVDLDQPVVTLTASDTEFCPDDNTITLTWNAVGTDLTCTASSIPLDTAFTGPIATSGTAVVTPTAPTTYSISCIAPGSDAAYQQTVSVALGECGDSDLILSAEPAPAQCTGAYRTDLSIYSPNSTTFMSCSPVTSIPAGPTYPITGAPNPGNGYMVVVPDVLAHTNPTVFQTTCYEPDATPGTLLDNPSMLVQTSVARSCAAPFCAFTDATISGSPLTADLVWTATGASSLAASGGWTGPKALAGGTQNNVAFSEPSTTYTLTATNPDGVSFQCSATLDEECEDPDPNDPNGEECDGVATVTLSADPTDMGIGGGSTVLEWESTGVVDDSCVGYSWPLNDDWNGGKTEGGMQSVSILTSTTFRIQCEDGFDGSYVSDDVTVSVEGTPTPDPECTDPLACPSVRTKPWYYER